MRDLRKYWQEIRARERELPAFVWLAGSGTVVEVCAAQAAKMMHTGAHRRATDEEIEAHKAAQDSLRQQAFREGLRRKGIAMVTVAPPAKKR